MNKKFQPAAFAWTVVLVLALSAIATVPVLADGGTAAPPAGPASGGRTSDQNSSSNSLSHLPAGTKVVIVDSNGEKAALGSQAAQQILTSGDPLWCPATLSAPTPTLNGCTQSFSGMSGGSGLLDYLLAHQSSYGKNGTIWIEDTYDSGSISSPDYGIPSFTMDGNSGFGTMKNFTLTIQGGWIGTPGSNTITGQSEFDGTLNIIHWNNNVTVNDILVQNTTAGDGLVVTTSKNITLGGANGVQSSDNSGGAGAYLDNTSGTSGTVTVTGGEFNNDFYTGLIVDSKGPITLNSITANSSTSGAGAYIDNCQQSGFCTGSGSVTLTGINTFNDNYFNGLEVYSNGNISANSLNASGNSIGYDGTTYNYQWSGGVLLENEGIASSTVTLTGNNSFTGNYESGLVVYSDGNITTNNLTASGNGAKGVVSGWTWAGAVISGFPGSAKLISVSGTNNTFDGNTGNGLSIETTDAITTNNLTANGNSNGNGAYVDNCFYIGGQCLVSGAPAVTMSGLNTFSNNSAGGLQVISYGNITAANLTATGNDTYGAWLYNNLSTSATTPVPSKGTVTVTGASALTGNTGDGLDVSSNGNISLSGVTSSTNGGQGADLDNTGGKGAVSVSSGVFNGNTGGRGLNVASQGAITLNSIVANDNSGRGAWVDNCLEAALATPPCTTAAAQAITVTGTNTFDGNGGGFAAFSKGAITLNNISAADSTSGSGVWVDNTGGTAGVTINNNTLDNNHGGGLWVTSNGAITVSNLTSTNSASQLGASLDNCIYNGSNQCTAPTAQPVTLSGTNTFTGNYLDGLNVQSYGSILASNLIANGNGSSGATAGGSGVWLNNQTVNTLNAHSKGTVTLTGSSTLDANYGDYASNSSGYSFGGLAVFSYGAIAASNVTANGNWAGNGVDLYNASSTTGAPITLTGDNTFNNNYNDGLAINSMGNISLNDIVATGNGATTVHGTPSYGYGAWIFNANAGSKGTVTLTGTNLFSLNSIGRGLYVESFGAIKASNLNATSNGQDGAYLRNADAPAAQAVTLTNGNVFSYNGGSGLSIYSNGALTLGSLTADGNLGGDGIYLDDCQYNGADCTGSFTSNVTMTGTDVFNDNYNSGLEVYTRGTISLNTTTLVANADGFGGSAGAGVGLFNYDAFTPKAVTVKGSSYFDGDYNNGLNINSLGAITMNNLTVTGSQASSGISIYNDTYDFPGAVGGVTLSGTNLFSNNAHNGMYIASSGPITVNNVTADGNAYAGIWLDNCNDPGSGCTTTAQAVTLAGAIVANNNGSAGTYNGILVSSKGAIKASNVTAIGNTLNGARFDNHQGSSAATVTLSGAGFFDYNAGGDGLLITAAGTVTLPRVTSSLNGGDGINITTPSTLSLACGTFVNNAGFGVNLDTNGAATLSGAVFIGNTGGRTNQTGSGGAPIFIPNCTLP
ncbi:MAG TPA: hypothetical protein VLZ89_16650 [Anaerolineales bacterium]|nr:hypothetical protein [Anaerolineales bacterium]